MQIRLMMLMLVIASAGWAGISNPTHRPQNLGPAPSDQIIDEFTAQIYPLLTRDEGGCFDCHASDSDSDLVFSGNAEEDFHMLADGKYFKPGPDSLLARLTSEHDRLRMPKDCDAWPQKELDRMAAFLRSLEESGQDESVVVDERFPRALLQPYRGEVTGQIDYQFLTYRQLKAKINIIFGDDWVRGGNDLFAEHVALFGGADFKTRFNETRDPRPAFLTGMEMLSEDIAHNSYQQRRGPFADWPNFSDLPAAVETPTPEYRDAITRLYERVLFRAPTGEEINQAFTLLQDIHRGGDLIRNRDHALSFELTVTDPLTKLEQKRFVQIPINGGSLEVHQQVVDQAKDAESKDKPLLNRLIGPVVELNPETENQRLIIHNLGTSQNVSFAGVEIASEEGEDDPVQTILAGSEQLLIDGAWEMVDQRGVKSLEDRNNHKGQSTITVPLIVAKPGRYRVTMLWRADGGNADNVLVELFAKNAGNQLVSPVKVTRAEPGEAQFFYDCGEDSVAFFQPPAAFQFDDASCVEVSNRGTRQRVTAGAVEFVERANSQRRFLVDSLQADGNDQWQRFNAGMFNAYNVKGTKLHDDNKRKGELSLRYAPNAQPPGKESKKPSVAWDSGNFYNVRIYFPGKANQESQVPVVIKATKSAPIIQLQHPLIAKSDARLKLDASASFTVQRSELNYAWRQISGAPVEIGDPSQAVIEFTAPRPDIEQFAWSSLCAGLMRHPDFLFTRPPSFFTTTRPQDKQKMQLVKLALDLVGRPPTQEEIGKLTAGAKLSDFVDDYLGSSEFREFYFHRVRLLLESQGTELDDEPARLWSYVAFNDRPFQEILTGEYSVDTEFNRQDRPAQHGKTGLLTTRGFIQGKPGLPHYNYAAQVSMLFLGYVYEVPDDIVEQREGVTALGTTDPSSACYSCHKILTPLSFQRLNWADDGEYRIKDESDLLIDASDRGSVAEYPFAGEGMAAFASQAVRKERFVRTMINTHVNFYFGRPMRYRYDERVLYKRLWDSVHANEFTIRELIRAIVSSPEYLNGGGKPVPTG